MLMLATISALAGAVLAQRFKVLVLAPAILFGLVTQVAGGIAHGEAISSIILASAVVATSLQLGYFGGLALRFSCTNAKMVAGFGLRRTLEPL
jgi:hypothetical protein